MCATIVHHETDLVPLPVAVIREDEDELLRDGARPGNHDERRPVPISRTFVGPEALLAGSPLTL